eukprot:jgi/Orpsp1_1/1175465/evm.model.c7180000054005.1
MSNKKIVLIKVEEALQFAGVVHLSFILNGRRKTTEGNKCPIRCRKCKGTFTKTNHARLISNNKKKGIICNNSCAFSALKTYLIDLFNHDIIEISKGSNNEPFITFKNEDQNISMNFFTPNNDDLKRNELFKPVQFKKIPLYSKKNNNADKNVSSTQGSINRIIIREKIKKYVVENSAKGKCKMVADTLKRKADHLPPRLKQMSKEDGLSKIKGVVSLTTKLYKVLKSNDLTLLYVKGIQRQSIKELKDSQN